MASSIYFQALSMQLLHFDYHFDISRSTMLGRLKGIPRITYHVANYSEKENHYVFETAALQKVHPLRNLAQGTDRILVTPSLLAIADHGTPDIEVDDHNLEDNYTKRLLAVIKYLYYQREQYYFDNLYKLVLDALQNNKKQVGTSTLTLAAINNKTGDINFYYVGDSLYGIFQDKNVVMVQPLYQSFHKPMRIGYESGYSPNYGYLQSYAKKEIKKDDVIVLASNGLWDNVHLDLLHYQMRGPGSYVKQNQSKKSKYPDAVGVVEQKQPKSLKEITQTVCNIGYLYSKRGNYESPIYLQARKQEKQMRKEGYLDDVSVILARRRKEVAIKRQKKDDHP